MILKDRDGEDQGEKKVQIRQGSKDECGEAGYRRGGSHCHMCAVIETETQAAAERVKRVKVERRKAAAESEGHIKGRARRSVEEAKSGSRCIF